jgi:hypothetical protein
MLKWKNRRPEKQKPPGFSASAVVWRRCQWELRVVLSSARDRDPKPKVKRAAVGHGGAM